MEDNFEELTAIDSILYGAGEFVLHDSIVNLSLIHILANEESLATALFKLLVTIEELLVLAPKTAIR